MAEYDPEILKRMQRTPATRAIDGMFLVRAQKALEEAGVSAIDFLNANPSLSTTELARRLNRGASETGLIMAIYREAKARGLVRETAKNLLPRQILKAFPNGWSSGGSVHPLVKVGDWSDDLKHCVEDAFVSECARLIIREITIERPPPEGWKPALENDPLIDGLFDRFWPPDGARV